MPKNIVLSEVVAHPNFPAYAVSAIAGKYVIVGGGGGAARTGIKNKFDVYELYHNGNQTSSERVVTHDVGDACVSNLIGWFDPQNTEEEKVGPTIHLAIGQEEQCVLLHLKPKLDSALPVDDIILEDDVYEEANFESGVGLRHRFPNEKIQELKEKRKKQERMRRESINSTLRGEKYFSFDIKLLSSVQSVFSSKTGNGDDIYQKVVRISRNHKLLATGGTDGRIMIWSVPNLKKIAHICAHDKEVDDLDFCPDGKEIVSVCKPMKECFIWNVKSHKRAAKLELPTNGIKYKFYKSRYGLVEDKPDKLCLFSISNAVTGSKHPSIIAKWNAKSHTLEKSVEVKGSLSSLAVSDNGRYLATGTMDGSIYIVIAFSLQVLQKIEDAHNMFVTGLEWLPTEHPDSKIVRGFSDASVLSISCDNALKIHHIPRQDMVPVWVVAVLTVIMLFGAFVIASYLGI